MFLACAHFPDELVKVESTHLLTKHFRLRFQPVELLQYLWIHQMNGVVRGVCIDAAQQISDIDISVVKAVAKIV